MAVGLALIYQEVGPSMFVAFALIVALMPVIGFVASFFGFYVKKKLAQVHNLIRPAKRFVRRGFSCWLFGLGCNPAGHL